MQAASLADIAFAISTSVYVQNNIKANEELTNALQTVLVLLMLLFSGAFVSLVMVKLKNVMPAKIEFALLSMCYLSTLTTLFVFELSLLKVAKSTKSIIMITSSLINSLAYLLSALLSSKYSECAHSLSRLYTMIAIFSIMSVAHLFGINTRSDIVPGILYVTSSVLTVLLLYCIVFIADQQKGNNTPERTNDCTYANVDMDHSETKRITNAPEAHGARKHCIRLLYLMLACVFAIASIKAFTKPRQSGCVLAFICGRFAWLQLLDASPRASNLFAFLVFFGCAAIIGSNQLCVTLAYTELMVYLAFYCSDSIKSISWPGPVKVVTHSFLTSVIFGHALPLLFY
jgi:hypothetical protein